MKDGFYRDSGPYDLGYDDGLTHERVCVAEFHDLVIGTKPADAPHMDPNECYKRAALIAEEACEIVAGLIGGGVAMDEMMARMIARQQGKRPSLAEYCDGAADLRYLLHGSDLVLGVHEMADEVFDLVHASNMAKAGGTRDANGKLQKPAGWTPPDIAGLLRKRLGWTE